jgi:capsular polysaccharide biosynthesis protein
MELHDAVRRIFRHHGVLVLILVVLGGGVAAGLHARDRTMFSATTRLVLDTADPQSATQSAAIADTARAIVTSPSKVGSALKTVGVKRDPVQLSKNDVQLQSLGTSGILQLTVRDPSPRVASALANQLATVLIQTRVEASSGQVAQVVSDLDSRINQFNAAIAKADSQIDKLNVDIGVAPSAANQNALRAQRDNVARLRDYVAQQRVVLESERDNLVATSAERPKPLVIDRAAAPSHPDSSHRLADLALGVFAGLIVATGIAAALETFRPTVVGSEAVAREADAPLLGELRTRPERVTATDVRQVSARLQLAAAAAHVGVVEFYPVEPSVELEWLVTTLRQGAVDAHDQRVGGGDGSRKASGPILNTFGSGTERNGHSSGLVIVAPSTISKVDLGRVQNLTRITGWPTLGVIAYKPRSFGLSLGGFGQDSRTESSKGNGVRR